MGSDQPRGNRKTAAGLGAVTLEDQVRLNAAASLLRKSAEQVGPLHGSWDMIFDLEACAQGKPTLLSWPAEKFIAHADQLLQNAR
jgi:hypothetical protein